MLKNFINQVIVGENLSQSQAQEAMQVIMSGQAGDVQISALLTALRIKGETSSEIAGFAQTMRDYAVKIDCDGKELIDTCGTGGDKKGTFNVSTTVAFVVAGAGLTVAKHGNSGVSSSCGSADVLSALGIHVNLPPEAVGTMIKELNIGFLYAPSFHKAMKYAAKPRKELGFRTIFNLLGPLTNPANANCQLIGVYDPVLTQTIGKALQELGVRRAMVVHSFDGMDEISTLAPTQVTEVRDAEIRSYIIEPADYGFNSGVPEDYLGGTPEDNAEIIIEILKGQKGAKRDIVLMNAAAALLVADKAATLEEGLTIAAASIDSGAALAKLEGLRSASQRYKEEFSLS
ncbi:anthranilate phosphoribosyltransferase [Pelosinus sp. sgz500959]|uniref:anthranilate phosphoribosyltransferase n=1 Tax=Pelosinus sp. sgz500959 TaxID=3242472 RepID=UPI00366BF427